MCAWKPILAFRFSRAMKAAEKSLDRSFTSPRASHAVGVARNIIEFHAPFYVVIGQPTFAALGLSRSRPRRVRAERILVRHSLEQCEKFIAKTNQEDWLPALYHYYQTLPRQRCPVPVSLVMKKLSERSGSFAQDSKAKRWQKSLARSSFEMTLSKSSSCSGS